MNVWDFTAQEALGGGGVTCFTTFTVENSHSEAVNSSAC